jgi:hypothetical protein
MASKKNKLVSTERPIQQSLFELVEPGDKNYSQAIEFYDALPKYFWANNREFPIDSDHAVLERAFTYRGNDYLLIITPATIKRKNETVFVYPSKREELVEDALRKLATSGVHGTFIDKHAACFFTLSELQNELQRMGHGFNKNQIKEAINVLAKTHLECRSKDGDSQISGNFFENVGLTTYNQYAAGATTKCYVKFSTYVTQAILSLKFRQFNYELSMALKSNLARHLYKRMAYNWRQAATGEPYTLLLSAIYRDTGRVLDNKMANNTRIVTNALNELTDGLIINGRKLRVLSSFTDSPIKDGRKFVDVAYTLLPHPDFIQDIQRLNQSERALQSRKFIDRSE